MTNLATIRRTYAGRILASVGVVSPALEAAYATVPREVFVGPGPWKVISAEGIREGVSDVTQIYEDVLVALVPEKRINNGQPSGHAMWLAAADARVGDHVVHIGAGTGYYTAILAEMVGPSGRVTAIEYDVSLAGAAAANLAGYAHVRVVHGDGVMWPFDPADVIYVNAGVTRPADNWLVRLKEGGRLVVPMTAIPTDSGGVAGAVFRFTRRGDEFEASFVSPTAFIPCEGLREMDIAEALAKSFNGGGATEVTRLTRGQPRLGEAVWFSWDGWNLLFRTETGE